MTTRYPTIYEEDDGWSVWLQPNLPHQDGLQAMRMACCDCKLVHNLEYRVVDGKVQYRIQRNNRATAQLRRHRGHSD